MADVSATGHPAAGQRTFDCPWCGAISRIPGDHLGEHFACPECKKATKLTDKNTSTLRPTAAPPDAPHLAGDRTFDCPWCGAIASIPFSHMGEHFHCPECGRQTKLTEKNTTRRAPTEAPLGAPHHAEASPGGRGVLVLLVLALLAVGAWMFFAGMKPQPPAEPPTPVASRPPTPAPPPPRTPETTPAEAAPGAPSAEPATPVAAPVEVAQEVTAARARVTDATAHVSLVQARLDDVRERLRGYAADGGEGAKSDLVVLREVAAESAGLRGKLGSDPTPDDARALNFAMVRYLEGNSTRVRVAEAAIAHIAKEPGSREVAGLSWRELNFAGLAFQRALRELDAAWAVSSKPAPPELREEEASAARALEAAKREMADADAALRALTEPK